MDCALGPSEVSPRTATIAARAYRPRLTEEGVEVTQGGEELGWFGFPSTSGSPGEERPIAGAGGRRVRRSRTRSVLEWNRMPPSPAPANVPSDRTVAILLIIVGGGLTLLGGVAAVLGLLSRGQEFAPVFVWAGLLALSHGAPWLAGSWAILRGSRAGYWGYVATGVVATVVLAFAFKGGGAQFGLAPFLFGVAPAILAARRLSQPRNVAAARPARDVARGLGLGATVLGALLGLRGILSLSFGRLGPPVPMEPGERERLFLFGGGAPLIGGLVLLAGGVVAMLGMRWGAYLALVGLLLAAAPYTLFAGPLGPFLLLGAGLLALKTISASTQA